MRKMFVGLMVLVFAIGLMVGLGPTEADAADGCYSICGCNGVPLTCCVTPFGTFCFPAIGFECPQIADC